jgi:bifunctional UDP-N-acetylglucosamine pyrophosphorylase/glucosamine-1-phosphate N-acetyltransferase
MNEEKRDLQAIVLAGGKGTRMKSDLPKVLHDLYGKSVIRHSIDNVREAGIGDVIVVVGYGRELVMEHLGDRVWFAVQEEQLGTGHAARQALPLLGEDIGSVVVCYGDMPFLRPPTFRALIDAQSQPGVAAAILTMELENPPDFGRVVRDGRGRVRRVVEVKDCTRDELKLKEFNVGVYCFNTGALRWALPRLRNDNAQEEYYLTDVVQILVEGGWRVKTVRTESIEETLGINDRADLELAERLKDIAGAESVSDLARPSRSDAGGERPLDARRTPLPEPLCDHDNELSGR